MKLDEQKGYRQAEKDFTQKLDTSIAVLTIKLEKELKDGIIATKEEFVQQLADQSEELLQQMRAELLQVQGLDGEDGKDGFDGEDGSDGKDGKDGRDGQDGKNGITPIKGVDYFTKKDIGHIALIASQKIKIPKTKKEPEIDGDKLLHIFTNLPEGKKLGTKHIDGLEQTLSAFDNQLRRGYLHGGGDTVSAGTGISITISGGTKVISASGGGVNLEIPTGTVDGSNASFTVLNTPKYITVDGLNKFQTTHYSYDSSTKTITITDGASPALYIRSFY